MRAEVIAIGDELTSGARVDTNSAWISQRLAEIGVPTVFHTTVADDLDACVSAFRIAASRADVVIMTGGLGPTADDLTREALSLATDRPLELRDAVLAQIQDMFTRRQRVMPAANRLQAMFPIGSTVIDNPHGTAPGVDLTMAGDITTRYFCLPGVPDEMRQMWHASVRPALLAAGAGRRIIKHRRLKCFGVGESNLEELLPDLIRRGRTPSVGITVHKATITLRVTAEAENETACDALIDPVLDTIRGCLSGLVFGDEDDELQHVVVRLLERNGQTLSTVEWGTPGLLSHWLGTVVRELGTSAYRGGTVVTSAAANPIHGDLFAQSESLDPSSSASAEQVTRRLAERTREQFASDFALAVGPITRGDVADSDVLWLALAHTMATDCISVAYTGHPGILADRAAKQALDLLRKFLLRPLSV